MLCFTKVSAKHHKSNLKIGCVLVFVLYQGLMLVHISHVLMDHVLARKMVRTTLVHATPVSPVETAKQVG
jgi:hypothetical protein